MPLIKLLLGYDIASALQFFFVSPPGGVFVLVPYEAFQGCTLNVRAIETLNNAASVVVTSAFHLRILWFFPPVHL